MNRRVPLGFYLSGIVSALYGVGNMLWLFFMDVDGGDVKLVMGLRLGAAILAAFAAVATEALWRARRWAYPASLALGLASGAALLGIALAFGGLRGMVVALVPLFLQAVIVVPIVLYVRYRSQQLFGIPRPAPQLPRPAPRVPVGARTPPATWW